jgi:outer membrane protein assembly factor BamB
LLPGETLVPVDGDLSGPSGDAIFTGIALRGNPSPGNGQLLSRDGRTGAVRWKSALPFVPVWVGCHADLVLTGGAEGVWCLRQEDGEPVWHFPAPAYDPYPTAAAFTLRPLSSTRHAQPLASFHLDAGRLFCTQGQRRLFALDAETGRVLWHEWAPGAAWRLPYPHSCFLPPLQAKAGSLAITTGSGRARLLDAATGELLHEVGTTATGPFSTLLVEGRGLCVASDSQRLQMEPVSGKTPWACEAPWTTFLTGRAPRLFGTAQALLVVWSTNLGSQVQRLDWATGKPLWSFLLPLDVEPPETAPWLIDDVGFYFCRGETLYAWSLQTGKPLWAKPLSGPAGGWRLQRCRDSLIAWPAAAGAWRFQFRWMFGSLQWDWARPGAGGAARLPIVCLDPRTGTLLERLNFAAPGPLPSPWAEPAAGENDFRPFLRLTRQGAVVAAAGEIWGLAAAKK